MSSCVRTRLSVRMLSLPLVLLLLPLPAGARREARLLLGKPVRDRCQRSVPLQDHRSGDRRGFRKQGRRMGITFDAPLLGV